MSTGHSNPLLPSASPRRPGVNTIAARPPYPEAAQRLKSAPTLERTTRLEILLAEHLPTPIPLPPQAQRQAPPRSPSTIWAGGRPASHNQGTAFPAKMSDASNERSPRIDFSHNATKKQQESPTSRLLGRYSQLRAKSESARSQPNLHITLIVFSKAPSTSRPEKYGRTAAQ